MANTKPTDPACRVPCPKCRAGAGHRCTDYTGRGKSTCKERVHAVAYPAEEKPNPPGPDFRLADLPGFPADAAAALGGRLIRTLADLRPHLESAAASDPTCEPAFAALGLLGVGIPARYHAGECLIGVLGGRVATLKLMAGWPEPAPKQPCGCAAVVNGLKGAHEPGCPYVRDSVRTGETMRQWAAGVVTSPEPFDENTPPPRTRPRGSPAPAYLALPPGESVTGVWHDWDHKGRVAEGSVLARFVGLWCPADSPDALRRPASNSGYLVAGNPVRGGTPLGQPGATITVKQIGAYRVASVVKETPGGALYAVLSPLEGR